MGAGQKVAIGAALIALLGGIVATVLSSGGRLTSVRGAILEQDSDPRKQAPIANVEITTESNLTADDSKSDATGFFRLTLLPGAKPGQLIALHLRHPDYHPLDITEAAGDKLYIIRMVPLHREVTIDPAHPEIVISNVIVRYSKDTTTILNVGSAVKTFAVANTGNVPCHADPPCSPDGKWKAAVASAALDAGKGDEFRNVRVACIAGPCPFTRVDSDGFSKGGQHVAVTVRNWSDTTTFMMQAEVFHSDIMESIQRSHPVIFGKTLDFTLPPAVQGLSIEAEVNGSPIIFPLGNASSLSWATCDVTTVKDKSKTYRCELKLGYRFG